ncbi:hypothetical protein pipiens_017051 [Culex pipiens pipiens]|uniref:Uncharacterized protein n=1 Tax=Culex pipiens pipiens TaxID=38569 RepID=A0ABD1CIL4_CULPP
MRPKEDVYPERLVAKESRDQERQSRSRLVPKQRRNRAKHSFRGTSTSGCWYKCLASSLPSTPTEPSPPGHFDNASTFIVLRASSESFVENFSEPANNCSVSTANMRFTRTATDHANRRKAAASNLIRSLHAVHSTMSWYKIPTRMPALPLQRVDELC